MSIGHLTHVNNTEYAGNAKIKDGQTVALEVNMNTPRTLTFFINGQQQPITISNIPPSIKFWINLCDPNQSFTLTRFERFQSSSSTSLLNSKVLQWGSVWNNDTIQMWSLIVKWTGNVSEDDLKQLFNPLGAESVVMLKSEIGIDEGQAQINFKSQLDAQNAFDETDGKNIRDCVLEVKIQENEIGEQYYKEKEQNQEFEQKEVKDQEIIQEKEQWKEKEQEYLKEQEKELFDQIFIYRDNYIDDDDDCVIGAACDLKFDFNPFGAESVMMLKSEVGIDEGQAQINFKSLVDAQNAFDETDGKNIRDCELEVKIQKSMGQSPFSQLTPYPFAGPEQIAPFNTTWKKSDFESYQQLIIASNEFIDIQSKKDILISVISYSDEVKVICNRLLNRHIFAIERQRGFGNNIQAALQIGIEIFREKLDEYKRRIVFFTNSNCDIDISDQINELKSLGVQIDAVGFGNVNMENLTHLNIGGGIAQIALTMDDESDFHIRKVIGGGEFGIVSLIREKSSQIQMAWKQMEYSNDQEKEMDAWNYVEQTTSALQLLHSIGIIHGDIKPANILLTGDNRIKLADFGLARKLKDGRNSATASGGTLHFMAPELLQYQTQKARQTKAADIWALGILFFKFLALKHPFISDQEQNQGILNDMVIQHILNDEPSDLPARFPESLRNLIKAMLIKDPTQRITAEQILNIPEVAASEKTKPIKLIKARNKNPPPNDILSTIGRKAVDINTLPTHENEEAIPIAVFLQLMLFISFSGASTYTSESYAIFSGAFIPLIYIASQSIELSDPFSFLIFLLFPLHISITVYGAKGPAPNLNPVMKRQTPTAHIINEGR
ncbi:MAG: putative Serine/threonine-protein kinase GRIK1 [Streblomastix strix]|uniref:Putative Serine/threonine-protein kinase GRIK1 n=1 Tax=Streblomastix strix TaxID=222440 RepID=A0A5J4WE95_9EUKA|nr:MAG: putative Serine/threonine-protein kinase GRIK1 [Streblomastix strix]